MDRANLTVRSEALVTRLTFEGKAVSGVEYLHHGKLRHVRATREGVLSLGAIHTPKVLMQSGIGDDAHLRQFDITVLQHLPGMGHDFQDYFMAPCVWEAPAPIIGRNNLGEVTALWKNDCARDHPDLQSFLAEMPYAGPEVVGAAPPVHGWSLTTAVQRRQSRGQLRLTGQSPFDPIAIDPNFLDDPEDVLTLRRSIEFCRDVGNSTPLRQLRSESIC
jgi:choline dehydrogenase